MKNRYAKIFGTSFENKIVNIEYSPGNDYYEFIREQREAGFKQIIITSEIMLKIIDEYFLNRKMNISSIEFMVDDDCLDKEVKSILNNMLSDRAYYNKLIDKIKFLIEESSIDIKKIELKGKLEDNTVISIFIQVNGILGINEDHFEDEAKRLVNKIAGWLQG